MANANSPLYQGGTLLPLRRGEANPQKLGVTPPSSGAKLRTNQQPNHRPNQPQTKPPNLAGF